MSSRSPRCGVYAITYIASGARYIGSSVDMVSRFTHHRYTLRRGIHKAKKLQELCDPHQYIEDAVVFEILELCGKDLLLEREQYWMDQTEILLNGKKSSDGSGITGPSEAQSIAAKRRWARPEYRARRQKFLEDQQIYGRFQKQQ